MMRKYTVQNVISFVLPVCILGCMLIKAEDLDVQNEEEVIGVKSSCEGASESSKNANATAVFSAGESHQDEAHDQENKNQYNIDAWSLENKAQVSPHFTLLSQAEANCRDEDRSFFHVPDFLLGKYCSCMRANPWRYSWQERNDMIFSLQYRGYARDAEALALSIFRKRIRWWLTRGTATALGVSLSVVIYKKWGKIKQVMVDHVLNGITNQFRERMPQFEQFEKDHPWYAWGAKLLGITHCFSRQGIDENSEQHVQGPQEQNQNHVVALSHPESRCQQEQANTAMANTPVEGADDDTPSDRSGGGSIWTTLKGIFDFLSAW